MKAIIYFSINRHTDDHFKVYNFTESNVEEIKKKITLWATDFFGEDIVEDQTINNPSISIPYVFAMGTEDYCQGYFIKDIEG